MLKRLSSAMTPTAILSGVGGGGGVMTPRALSKVGNYVLAIFTVKTIRPWLLQLTGAAKYQRSMRYASMVLAVLTDNDIPFEDSL